MQGRLGHRHQRTWKKSSSLLSPEEIEWHALTHQPFHSWCLICQCAHGRPGHRRRKNHQEQPESIIQMDYAYMNHAEEPQLCKGSGGNITILMMIETSPGMAHAIAVNRKCEHIHWLKPNAGLHRMALRSPPSKQTTRLLSSIWANTLPETRTSSSEPLLRSAIRATAMWRSGITRCLPRSEPSVFSGPNIWTSHQNICLPRPCSGLFNVHLLFATASSSKLQVLHPMGTALDMSGSATSIPLVPRSSVTSVRGRASSSNIGMQIKGSRHLAWTSRRHRTIFLHYHKLNTHILVFLATSFAVGLSLLFRLNIALTCMVFMTSVAWPQLELTDHIEEDITQRFQHLMNQDLTMQQHLRKDPQPQQDYVPHQTKAVVPRPPPRLEHPQPAPKAQPPVAAHLQNLHNNPPPPPTSPPLHPQSFQHHPSGKHYNRPPAHRHIHNVDFNNPSLEHQILYLTVNEDASEKHIVNDLLT